MAIYHPNSCLYLSNRKGALLFDFVTYMYCRQIIIHIDTFLMYESKLKSYKGKKELNLRTIWLLSKVLTVITFTYLYHHIGCHPLKVSHEKTPSCLQYKLQNLKQLFLHACLPCRFRYSVYVKGNKSYCIHENFENKATSFGIVLSYVL